ncbi:S1 RNA-binding domain-containing protein [Kitasatospora sp. NPDC101235]|uniref:S1 RNA-binding domain-containing protein n=1 Tax=Kitasatospora sp. NPDC101235 TaxID=3364101 RepID=UPI0037F4273C
MVTDAEWARIREGLRFGQVFEGTVVRVPRPGVVGIFVDIGLSVEGFVDVLLLPERSESWPAEGTVSDFEVWWADSRKQIRLKPTDPQYLRADFAGFMERVRPGWPSEVGCVVRDPGSPMPDELLASLRRIRRGHEVDLLQGDLLLELRLLQAPLEGGGLAAGDLVLAEDLKEVQVAELAAVGLGQANIEGLRHP